MAQTPSESKGSKLSARGAKRTPRALLYCAKPLPPGSGSICGQPYFAFFSLIAACAAARRAIGTRNGEQET